MSASSRTAAEPSRLSILPADTLIATEYDSPRMANAQSATISAACVRTHRISLTWIRYR